jgi:hypothetical protein
MALAGPQDYTPVPCLFLEKLIFKKLIFNSFIIRKIGKKKYFLVKEKFSLVFKNVFLKNLDGKHFLEIVKNLEISLFADYIKFDPQIFDCYI